MKIVVMISGKMRSGKNTFADILIEEINKIDPDKRVRYDFFARPVKEQAKEVFRPLTNYLNAVSESCGIPQLFTDDDNWYEDKNSITRILRREYSHVLVCNPRKAVKHIVVRPKRESLVFLI